MLVVPTVALAGTSGTVGGTGGTAALSWSPTTSVGAYDYGQLNVGQTVPKAFTLTNSGSVTTSALKIGMSGSSTFTKAADTCAGASLGAGKSCNVTITFAPAGSGQSYKATLAATSSKPSASGSLALLGASPAKNSPALSTTPGPGGPVGATTVTDTASLTGGNAPTGTVTFTLYGPSATANCTTTPVDTEKATVTGNGSYTTPTGGKPSQAGTYWWTASYSGDGNNAKATSKCRAEKVVISQASPAITTTASSGGKAGATTVTDKATLSGGLAPTGTVTFSLYGPSPTPDCPAALLVGTATATVSGGGATGGLPVGTPRQAGTYWWTAAYGGDGNNAPVSSGCGDESVTLTPLATPALVTSPSGDGTVGSNPPILDSADLSGGNAPTGLITFSLYGPSPTADCSNRLFVDGVTVNGNGTYATAGGPSLRLLPPGTYWWTAAYGGDGNNNPVSSGCGDEKVVIGQASPAITTNASSGGKAGATTVTDFAMLSGGLAPTGTVTFSLYGPSPTPDCSAGLLVGTDTGTVGSDGTATTPTGFTPSQAGTYWWTAAYGGDVNNNPVATNCGDEQVVIGP